MTTSDIDPDSEPQSPPSESRTSDDSDRKRFSTQTRLIISLYALVAFSAAFNVFHYDSLTAYFACSIVFAILATTWALNDSRLRNRTFYPVLRMLHVLFCPVSLVIYLACTRGFRGLGMAVLHTVGMIAVAYFAFYFVFYAIYFTGYWDLYDPIYFE